MNSYSQYKKWWMKHQAPHEIPSLYYGDTPESAFKQHIKDMSVYKLMETLEGWEEEVPVQEPDITKLLNDAIEQIKQQPLHSPMEQTPSRPYPYLKYPTENYPKPQCSKCGIALSGVMGYVCNDMNCPTFMKVTC